MNAQSAGFVPRCKQKNAPSTNILSTALFHGDSDYVCVSGTEGIDIVSLNTKQATRLCTTVGSTTNFSDCIHIRGNTYIHAVAMESTVYLFDPLGKEPIQLVQLRLSSKGISGSTQIAFCHRPLSEGFLPNINVSTENSFLFATCHTQSALLFWELTVSSGKDPKIVSVKKFTFSTCHEELQKLKGVTAIGFSKSGLLFATGHKTGEVHIWNLLNKSEHTILHSRRPITLIDWSYKKDELIALSEDNILKVYSATDEKSDGRLVSTKTLKARYVPNLYGVAILSTENTIQFYQLYSFAKPVFVIDSMKQPILTFALEDDTRMNKHKLCFTTKNRIFVSTLPESYIETIAAPCDQITTESNDDSVQGEFNIIRSKAKLSCINAYRSSTENGKVVLEYIDSSCGSAALNAHAKVSAVIPEMYPHAILFFNILRNETNISSEYQSALESALTKCIDANNKEIQKHQIVKAAKAICKALTDPASTSSEEVALPAPPTAGCCFSVTGQIFTFQFSTKGTRRMRTYLDYLKVYGEKQEHNEHTDIQKENDDSIESATPHLESDDDDTDQGIEKQNSDTSIKELNDNTYSRRKEKQELYLNELKQELRGSKSSLMYKDTNETNFSLLQCFEKQREYNFEQTNENDQANSKRKSKHESTENYLKQMALVFDGQEEIMFKDKFLVPITPLSKSPAQKAIPKEKNYTQLCDISSILSPERSKRQSTSKKARQTNMKNFSQKNILRNAIEIISETGCNYWGNQLWGTMTDELYNTLYRRKDVQMLALLAKCFVQYSERQIIRSFYENSERIKNQEFYKYPFEHVTSTKEFDEQTNNSSIDTLGIGKIVTSSPSCVNQNTATSQATRKTPQQDSETTKYNKRNSVTIENPCVDGQAQTENRSSIERKFSIHQQTASSQTFGKELSALDRYKQLERQYALDHAYFLISKKQLALNNSFIEAYCKLLCRWKNYEKMTALYRFQIMQDDIHTFFQSFLKDKGWERTPVSKFVDTPTSANSITLSLSETNLSKIENSHTSIQPFSGTNKMHGIESLAEHVSSYKEPNTVLHNKTHKEEKKLNSLRRSMDTTKERNKPKQKKQSSQKDLTTDSFKLSVNHSEHENQFIQHGASFSSKPESANKLHESKTISGIRSDVIGKKLSYCNETNTTKRVLFSVNTKTSPQGQGYRNIPSSLNMSGLRTTEPSPPDRHIDTKFHRQLHQDESEPLFHPFTPMTKHQHSSIFPGTEPSFHFSEENDKELQADTKDRAHITAPASVMLENIIELDITDQQISTDNATAEAIENAHKSKQFFIPVAKHAAQEEMALQNQQLSTTESHRRLSMDSQFRPQRFTKAANDGLLYTGSSFKSNFLYGGFSEQHNHQSEPLRSPDDTDTHFCTTETGQPTETKQSDLTTKLPNHPWCGACGTQIDGLAVTCALCGHCGHLSHYKEWFMLNSICPTLGCECQCRQYFKVDTPAKMND